MVVVGGGFGGATAAKYLRLWDPAIEVVLVERESAFTSCPISNLVLAGYPSMDDISHGYDGLRRHGVQVVQRRSDRDRRGEEDWCGSSAAATSPTTGWSSRPASISISARSRATRRR